MPILHPLHGTIPPMWEIQDIYDGNDNNNNNIIIIIMPPPTTTTTTTNNNSNNNHLFQDSLLGPLTIWQYLGWPQIPYRYDIRGKSHQIQFGPRCSKPRPISHCGVFFSKDLLFWLFSFKVRMLIIHPCWARYSRISLFDRPKLKYIFTNSSRSIVSRHGHINKYHSTCYWHISIMST